MAQKSLQVSAESPITIPMFDQLLGPNKIVPVATVTSEGQAVQLMHSLVAGGVTVIEITLRTPIAVNAIDAVKQQVPSALVLAGSVTSVEALQSAVAAGVDGVVSPAFSEKLVRAALAENIPLLPGVATPSEIVAAMDAGFTTFKFFPAAACGGIDFLKAVQGPLPNAQFCPTGGLTMDNFIEYLQLPNVMSVGGSWMLTKQLIEAEQWADITALAKQSVEKLMLLN